MAVVIVAVDASAIFLPHASSVAGWLLGFQSVVAFHHEVCGQQPASCRPMGLCRVSNAREFPRCGGGCEVGWVV